MVKQTDNTQKLNLFFAVLSLFTILTLIFSLNFEYGFKANEIGQDSNYGVLENVKVIKLGSPVKSNSSIVLKEIKETTPLKTEKVEVIQKTSKIDAREVKQKTSALLANSNEIYISSCQKLNQAGKTYYLNKSLSGSEVTANCIEITAPGVVFDCQGNSIKNSNLGSAIIYSKANDVSIKNCEVQAKLAPQASGAGTGILISASNNKIENNIVRNTFWGINVYGSNNLIQANTLEGNGKGIHLELNNNIVKENLVKNNKALQGWGLGVWRGQGNQFVNNKVYGNNYGIVLYEAANTVISCGSITGNSLKDAYLYSNNNKNITYFGTTLNKVYVAKGAEFIQTAGSCENLECTWEGDECVEKEAAGIVNINSCRTLDQAGTTYVLQNDVTTTGTCFTITADNIVLDGNGFTIDGDDSGQDYGVYVSGRNNITIKNFKNIKDFGDTSNFGAGIWLRFVSNSVINNVSVSSSYMGIKFYSSSNNILNEISANSNYYGIHFSSSLDNTLSYVSANSNNYGIYLYSSLGNALSSVSANSNYYSGIFYYSSSNNKIIDSNIFNPDGTDVYLSASLNNIFLNTFYNVSSESVQVGSSLIRKWYYTAYVNDSEGNSLENVNIQGYDSNENLQFNLTTKSNGLTDKTEIIEYINNGGVKTYYSPYEVYAISSLYPSVAQTWDLTLQKSGKQEFTLGNEEAAGIVNINSCRTLDQAGTTYVLQNDVTTTGTCFTITADNITLDCGNWNNSITYGNVDSTSFFYGISSNSDNTIIKNCNLIKGDAAKNDQMRFGIQLLNSDNSRIENTKANNNYRGIYLLSSSNTLLKDVIASSNQVDGIVIDFGSNNDLFNVTTDSNLGGSGIIISYGSFHELKNVKSSYNAYNGVFIKDNSNSNILDTLFVSSNGYDGIILSSSSKNKLMNIDAPLNQYGIDLLNSYNNTISSSKLCSNSLYDLHCYMGSKANSGTGNTFGNGKVTACEDNQWPLYPRDYSYC
ncbi:MAG: NosD domain-containing protein [Candidatus Nanoarchaeia archaeon]